MNDEELRNKIAAAGELIVKVEEIDSPLELHVHDTEVADGAVVLELSDGTFEFDIDRIAATWKHYHSLADYSLE